MKLTTINKKKSLSMQKNETFDTTLKQCLETSEVLKTIIKCGNVVELDENIEVPLSGTIENNYQIQPLNLASVKNQHPPAAIFRPWMGGDITFGRKS